MSDTLSRLVTAYFKPRRGWGTVIPDVVFEEVHRRSLTITEHPVQTGASISDHRYRRPEEVTIRAGWSYGILQTFTFGAMNEVLARLQALQDQTDPFTVITGKRSYKNMLMSELQHTTDRKTENVLEVTATFREVIIVEVQTTKLPPAANQSLPQKTQQTSDVGVRQPVEVKATPENISVPRRLIGN